MAVNDGCSNTKCWKRMFFCPLFPPWAHPVPPCLPSCWSPYFIIPTLAHTHWEYPVVRCELVGNNKQWRGSLILAGRAQVGPCWYLTPFFHYFYFFLPVLTSTMSLQVGPYWYLTPLVPLLAQTTSTFASAISLQVGSYRYLTPSNTCTFTPGLCNLQCKRDFSLN